MSQHDDDTEDAAHVHLDDPPTDEEAAADAQESTEGLADPPDPPDEDDTDDQEDAEEVPGPAPLVPAMVLSPDDIRELTRLRAATVRAKSHYLGAAEEAKEAKKEWEAARDAFERCFDSLREQSGTPRLPFDGVHQSEHVANLAPPADVVTPETPDPPPADPTAEPPADASPTEPPEPTAADIATPADDDEEPIH